MRHLDWERIRETISSVTTPIPAPQTQSAEPISNNCLEEDEQTALSLEPDSMVVDDGAEAENCPGVDKELEMEENIVAEKESLCNF